MTAILLIALLAQPQSPASQAPSQRIPIILDTDIGTDIDDAFALALALDSPELDLVGVTTVSGDTLARAAIAAKMLSECGRGNIPVYAGVRGKPLPCEQCRWAAGFRSPALHGQGAVDFLEKEISRRPGRLTLVTIGPLTNVAALIKRDPEAAVKIRRIVMMGGSIRRGYAPGSHPEPEYNIATDVLAAQKVFTSGVPIVMAPLDVTAMLQLDRAGLQRIFSNPVPLSRALDALDRLWGRETPTLYDPQAVALLLDPSLCETERLHVEVDARGLTAVLPDKPPNTTVALRTDPKRFFDFYLRRVAPPR